MSLQKQHHINQLLSTAATGTGVVNDVDALLTPIQVSPVPRAEPKAERNLWREDEMMQMLKLMRQENALELLNDKSVKSEQVFRNIEQLMFERGYRKKSYLQIWTKWKFLKSTYMTTRRAGTVPKMIPPSIYRVLDSILRSSATATANGSAANPHDARSSSLDGDHSTDNGRLVISRVESAVLTNGAGKGGRHGSASTAAARDEGQHDDTALDVAHPIFGYRLGLVKQEPADTGYETNQLNGTASECEQLYDSRVASSTPNSTTNANFPPEIKLEVEEAASCHSPRDPPEGVKKPTASRPTVTPVPEAAAAPRNSQMPPLRIANFAKAPAAGATQRQPQLSRSPPPLSMQIVQPHQQQHPSAPPASHRHFTRQSQVHATSTSTGSVHMARVYSPMSRHCERLIPTTPSGAPIRLPPDIVIHETRSSPATASHHARQTHATAPQLNHKLQQDESVLPDAESADSSLQQQVSQCYASSYAHAASTATSKQAAASAARAALKQRKRRLQLPHAANRPSKVSKTPAAFYNWRCKDKTSYPSQVEGANAEANGGGGRLPLVDTMAFKQKPPKSKLQQKYFQQQQQKYFQQQQQQKYLQQQQHQQQHQQQQAKAQVHREADFIGAALKDLGKSLRSAQRQILDDFFERQMKLAREEREFQARQDKLLLDAFVEQTHSLLESVKDLLGVDLSQLGKKKTADAKGEEEAKDADTSRKKAEQKQRERMGYSADEREEETVQEYYQHDQEKYEQQEAYLDDADVAENEDEDEDESGSGDDDDDDDDTDTEEVENDDEEQIDHEYDNEMLGDDYQRKNPGADPIELVSSELTEHP